MNIILWSTQKINLPESTSQNLTLPSYFHNLFSIFSLLNTLDNLCVPQGQEKTCFSAKFNVFLLSSPFPFMQTRVNYHGSPH